MQILISEASSNHFSPKKQSLVTDWQSGNNDFSEERLDDDSEVFTSVVAAGFHEVVQHALKEQRRSKCLKNQHV